jgi:hypothetical protein
MLDYNFQANRSQNQSPEYFNFSAKQPDQPFTENHAGGGH